MIEIEPCKGCGRTLFTVKVANLDVRCEVEALDAQEALSSLLAGRELWRATATSLTPSTALVLAALNSAEPGERPHVVQTHICKAVSGRLPASQGVGGPTPPKAPPGPPVAPSAASLGPSTGLSGVLVAVNHPSDPETDLPETARRPTCDACGLTCEPRTYTGIMLGGTWIHVWHNLCI